MNPSVVVPTYRRPGPLAWSLESVLRQATPPGATRARVLVVNNDARNPRVDEAVERARSRVPGSPWTVSVLHRGTPMNPVLSWYGAIADFAEPGDLVLLHGDDDLMLRGSVVDRAAAFEGTGASVLLTRSLAGLVFDSDRDDLAYLEQSVAPRAPETRATVLRTARDVAASGSAFIGNHAYRATPAFTATYERVLAWMRTIPLEGAHQLAMLPFLLPLGGLADGVVASAEIDGCIRGQSTAELVRGRFGNANWSGAVLAATNLWLFDRHPEIRGIEGVSALAASQERELARFVVAGMADRPTRKELLALWPAVAPRLRRLRRAEVASGLVMLALDWTGTQSLRKRVRGWGRAVDRATAMRELFPGD